mgnify:FL=1|jgi:uncharacterized protein (UPF0333 family)
MQFNSKFFLGLTLGLALGFVAFNVGSANSTNSKSSAIDATNDATNGDFITAEQANPLEENYKNYIDGLNQNGASIGGVVGESNLRDITKAIGGNGLVKYRFYKTEEPGEAKIGIIFYAPNGKILKTGASAFCPTICDPGF